MNSGTLKILLIFLTLCFSFLSKAEVVNIYDIDQIKQPLHLVTYIQLLEDQEQNINLNEIVNLDYKFSGNNQFKPKKPNSTFWVKVELNNCTDSDLFCTLSFKNLTYVDLFELCKDSLLSTHHAGLFRSKKDISFNDEADLFNIKLKANKQMVYYLKINHSKGYRPLFDFTLQDEKTFHHNKTESGKIDYLIFGAFIIFFLYSLLNYLFNHYAPYLWLACYILGMALYSFNLSGFLLDFFPNHPKILWGLNTLFTSSSAIGGIMLISSFFNLKESYPSGFVVLNILASIEIGQLIIGQLIILIFQNYWIMTLFFIVVTLTLVLPAIIYIPIKIWKNLAPPQKMFSIAIFLYIIIILIGLFLLIYYKEKSILSISYLGNLSGIIAILFFTISLSEQSRGIVVERNQILVEINKLKNEQNKILEELVNERTKELREVNLELLNGKELLLQRNERIELLLKELHHRVKNNLQLISSFYDLRLVDQNKKSLKDISREIQNRIKIMSLVHDMLYHGDKTNTIDIDTFIRQIAINLDSFSISGETVNTKIECDNLKFDMDTAIPLGLILNELLNNSLKHSIPQNGKLELSISIINKRDYSYILTITDNGKQIGEDIINQNTQSFGLHMIYLLSKQLNGNFTYKYDGKNNFIVKFMDSEGRQQIP